MQEHSVCTVVPYLSAKHSKCCKLADSVHEDETCNFLLKFISSKSWVKGFVWAELRWQEINLKSSLLTTLIWLVVEMAKVCLIVIDGWGISEETKGKCIKTSRSWTGVQFF